MKLLAKIIIIIAVFVAGFYVGHQYALSPSNGSPATVEKKEEIRADLKVDFGAGGVLSFENISLPEETTVFALLEKVAAENNLELGFKDYGELGVMVESIGSMTNDAAADLWWQYWVNGDYAEIGASNHQLQDGDSVEWKYIKGQIN